VTFTATYSEQNIQTAILKVKTKTHAQHTSKGKITYSIILFFVQI